MKTVAIAIVALLGSASAFAPQLAQKTAEKASLHATADRRQFSQQAAAVIGGAAFAFSGAAPALAVRGVDYTPKFDDLKVLYQLGLSLDRLVDKYSREETVEAGLNGVREFNKQPKFYPGYAKNYVSKIVLNNADADPRVGYVKQVSSTLKIQVRGHATFRTTGIKLTLNT